MTLERKEIRVMLVDDDEFALTILGEALQQWSEVLCASSVAQAIEALQSFDPNVVITDLDFNGGPDGGQLLNYLEKEHPWIARVVLTSHASPTLAIGKGLDQLNETVYLVKADMAGSQTLKNAIYSALSGEKLELTAGATSPTERIEITKSQAKVLQLIASGRSNAAIAEQLDISLRAAEGLVQRTFSALGLTLDSSNNARVLATRMWLDGRVSSK